MQPNQKIASMIAAYDQAKLMSAKLAIASEISEYALGMMEQSIGKRWDFWNDLRNHALSKKMEGELKFKNFDWSPPK